MARALEENGVRVVDVARFLEENHLCVVGVWANEDGDEHEPLLDKVSEFNKKHGVPMEWRQAQEEAGLAPAEARDALEKKKDKVHLMLRKRAKAEVRMATLETTRELAATVALRRKGALMKWVSESELPWEGVNQLEDEGRVERCEGWVREVNNPEIGQEATMENEALNAIRRRTLVDEEGVKGLAREEIAAFGDPGERHWRDLWDRRMEDALSVVAKQGKAKREEDDDGNKERSIPEWHGQFWANLREMQSEAVKSLKRRLECDRGIAVAVARDEVELRASECIPNLDSDKDTEDADVQKAKENVNNGDVEAGRENARSVLDSTDVGPEQARALLGSSSRIQWRWEDLVTGEKSRLECNVWSGYTRACLEAPCGTGKTIIGTDVALEAVRADWCKGRRVFNLCVVALFLDLLSQDMEKALNRLREKLREGGGEDEPRGEKVTVEAHYMCSQKLQSPADIEEKAGKEEIEHVAHQVQNSHHNANDPVFSVKKYDPENETAFDEIFGKAPTEMERSMEIRVLFTTYKSLSKIHEGTRPQDYCHSDSGFAWDMMLFDEAHTMATQKSGRIDEHAMALYDNRVRARRRLFMTATPKVSKVSEKKREDGDMDLMHDMSNPELFGTIGSRGTYSLDIREAVERGLICEYMVFAAGNMGTSEATRRRLKALERGRQSGKAWRQATTDEDPTEGYGDTGGNGRCIQSKSTNRGEWVEEAHAIKAQAIAHALRGRGGRRAFCFNTDVKESELEATALSVEDALKHVEQVDSYQRLEDRQRKVNEFKDRQKDDGRMAISTARTMALGMDVPRADTVCLDGLTSTPEAVLQAVGRALRVDLENPDKVALVVVPVFQIALEGGDEEDGAQPQSASQDEGSSKQREGEDEAGPVQAWQRKAAEDSATTLPAPPGRAQKNGGKDAASLLRWQMPTKGRRILSWC